MKFNDLAWAALLYYYKSSADKRYVKLFRDAEFISKLRERPWDIPYEEFEDKVVFSYISSIGLRLPTVRGTDNLLTQIVELHPNILALQGLYLRDCDLSNEGLLQNIRQIYEKLQGIHGFWLTGISKIAHIFNDALFVAINLGTSSHFGLLGEVEDFIKWLKMVQQSAQEVSEDFENLGLPGSPAEFLSEKLGYTNYGCQKTLARFIDEYYWLATGENLPVPPKWLPSDSWGG
ncbi:MAG: hypothetical protein JSV54_01480 [Chloroflexota bacterium]|nr:MAG: hypothetical protein JSV54_01480 [Chloroflexota bacterium]